MRVWSEQDAMVKKVVTAAYQSRIEFIGSIFRRMGFRGKDVEIRVRLLLCYMSWEPNLHPQESRKRRFDMLNLQYQILAQV
ncbi:hypothetical protein [Gimesia aquarii]|uniref:Uncharacterized protein n=1 Tax=Gimesia aquarii TaxID=2527964 RepID=A0A517WWL5_9PLAN|nr:hypothetical protein [Gimesia aquarii]QDU09667.1 hypothetical protein V202x_30430 [Gimesia aquarii]